MPSRRPMEATTTRTKTLCGRRPNSRGELLQLVVMLLDLCDDVVEHCVLRLKMRLQLQAFAEDCLRVLVCLLRPLVGRFPLDVLSHDDDGEQDQLDERLRDPGNNDDRLSAGDRRR